MPCKGFLRSEYRPHSTSIHAFPLFLRAGRRFCPSHFVPLCASLSPFLLLRFTVRRAFPHNTPPSVEKRKKSFPSPLSVSFTIPDTDWSSLRSRGTHFQRNSSGTARRTNPLRTRPDRLEENVSHFSSHETQDLCGPFFSGGETQVESGGWVGGGGVGGLAKRIPLREAHRCNFTPPISSADSPICCCESLSVQRGNFSINCPVADA